MAGVPRSRRRVKLLLGLGLIAVTVALVARQSPWLAEWQLKRASLPVLQSWTSAAPRDAAAQYYLGSEYYNQGLLPESITAFQRAVTLDPKMARAYTGLSLAKQRAGQIQEAVDAGRQAVALAPRSADAQFALAYATYGISKARAKVEFDKLTRLAPRRADAWHWLGTCSMDLNDPSAALAPMKKAAELDARNPVYHRDLGEVLLGLSRFDESRPHLEFAASQAQSDPEASYLLGRWQVTTAKGKGDLERANILMLRSIQLLELDLNPDKVNIAAIQLERADVLRQLKRPEEARKALEEARRLDPNNLPILHRLALTLRDLGRRAESEKLLTEYSVRSNGETELNNLIERVKQDGKNAALRLRLARLWTQAGDLARGLNQYDVCLWLDPTQAAAKGERAALLKRLEALGRKVQSGASGPGIPPSNPQR